MTFPHRSIENREEAKGPSSHNILFLIREKSFSKLYQKDSLYISLTINAARTKSRLMIQEERKMTIG